MTNNIERGAREIDNSRPDSKFRNHAVDVSLTVSLLSSAGKASSDLRQYSASNISQHQRNDTASEKKETKYQKKAFQAEGKRYLAVDEKRELLRERSDVIKEEYGSIRDYNIAKQSPDFMKSERLQDVEFRVVEIDGKIRDTNSKFHKFSDKADNIRAARCHDQSLRAGGKIYDKREVKEAKHRRKAFKAEDSRYVCVEGKRELLRERSEIIKAEYSSFQNYNNAKKSAGFEKSAKLRRIEARISALDGEINIAGGKFKQHSGSAEKLFDKRSQSKYFSEGGNSLTSENKLERKAAKADVKLAKAERQINHRVIRKSYKFNSETGKIKKSLVIEKRIKPINKGGIVSKGLKGAGAVTAMRLSTAIHGEFSKNENDLQNCGAKAAHTAERFAEHTVVKTAQRAHKFIHEAPYKRASKLQMKADKANAKLYAKRKGGTARQMKKNAKQYMNKAKQARTAKSASAKIADKITAGIKQVLKTVGGALGKFMLIACGGLLLIMLVMSIVLGFATAIGGNSGSLLGLYLAEDEQIYAAESYAQNYSATAVQTAIDGLIAAVPTDYVVINPYTLGHNPYALISFLSAFSFGESGNEYDNSFNANDTNIRAAIEAFINTLYYIEYSVSVTTATVTDGYGNVEIITHTTLTVSVLRRTEDEAAQIVFNSGSPYTPEMYDLYLMYMETNGFREDLFPEWAV